MHILAHQLGNGTSLELNARALPAGSAKALWLVAGGGRGCVLKVEGPVAGLWIPLRGRLQLGAANDVFVHPGEARVSEAEPRMQAIGRGNAMWAAILGTPAAWRAALGGWPDASPVEPLLLPAMHAADRELRRSVIALVRAPGGLDQEIAVGAVLDRVLGLQHEFAPAIERCPGRTYTQRRQVFLRLQRVRNYLGANCHLDVDNDSLARMASYSPWHFIRAFRAAYGETPHAYLVRQRLERARRLLRGSPLAISEIALASGFENRCAFSRLFRQRYGTTAGAVRRQGHASGSPLHTVAAG